MNKIYIIVIGIIIFLLLAGLVFLAFFTNSNEQSQNNTNRAVQLDPNNIPKDKSISVPNRSGGVTKVNNFLLQSDNVETDRVGMVQETSGGITYSLQDSTFYITISAETEEEMEGELRRMERELLSQLSITEQEACALSVNIRTMPSLNPETSDRTLELSFCKQN